MLTNDKTFSIRETVNKNIERVQFPAFNNHRSLIGWCGMNYPKVLMNPQYMAKPKPKEPIENLDYIFQMRAKERQNQNLVKPFTTYLETNQAIQKEGLASLPNGYKQSLMSLTTTSQEKKAEILRESFKGHEKYMGIRPLSCELGQKPTGNFSRRIRQIGEVYYTQSYESEEIRHLKKLPNSVITEQNLMEILNQDLKYLNMHNHTWISKEQVNKIGYFAPNIEEIVLSSTEIDDDTLVELGRSCKQYSIVYNQRLKRIDISSCRVLTERGVRTFLEMVNDRLESFKCPHNIQSATDYSLEPLRFAPLLKCLNVSFCNNLSQNILQYVLDAGSTLLELQVSTLEGLTGDLLAQVITKSKDILELLDASFIPTKDISDVVTTALGQCRRLQILILTGSNHVNDMALNKLSQGGGLPHLTVLKLGGLQNVSDNGISLISQVAPNLKQIELNNLERLTENVLETLTKNCHNLELLNLNFTPNISDQALIDRRAQLPQLTIIRNINKMTDPKDDGLRMPLPLKSVVMQRPKKKKKKK